MAATTLPSWDLLCPFPLLPCREGLLASHQPIMRFLTQGRRTQVVSWSWDSSSAGTFLLKSLSSSLTVPGTSLHLGLKTKKDLYFSLFSSSSRHFGHKTQLALVNPQPCWGRWCRLGPSITVGSSPAGFLALLGVHDGVPGQSG